MELDIKIAPDGTLQLHMHGVKGKACLETAELFKRLVGPQTSQKLTGDYYADDAHVTRDIRNL